MKHNWEYKKLGDICSFERGVTYSKKDESEVETDNIILRSNNIDLETYSLNTYDLKYLKADFYIKNEKRLKANSILICMSNGSLAHLGKTAFVSSDSHMAFGGFMGLIIPKTDNPKYISYFFRSKLYTEFLESLNRGANIRNLQFSRLSELEIPIPPTKVQEQIVAEMDNINEIISDCKEAIRNLDTLTQSLFYDCFGDPLTNPKGWNTATLDYVSSQISNGANAKIECDTYKTSGIMFFRCQNVWRNRIDYSDIVYVDEGFNNKFKSSSLKHNDLLVTKIGRLYTENSSLGRVSLYEGEDYKANLSGNLSFIRLNEKVRPKFILYILISSYFRDYVRNTTAGGIDKRALNNAQLKAFPIYIPPIELQEKFASRIEQIEQQKKDLEETIANMQTLLNSRMDYWFN